MCDSNPASRESVNRLYRPSVILIDLDGTLIDSVPDLSMAANLMLKDLGRELISRQCVQGFVGNGIDNLIHRCLTGTLEGEADTSTFTAARRLFFAHYREHNGHHSHLYPGTLAGIQQFQEAGIKLACITNKATCFSEQLLQHFGIRDCFTLLIAGDTLAYKKPHPQPLLHAANHFEVPVLNCLMIGDSIHDVAAARAAGMPVVAVSYGYNHGQDIRDAHPDAVINRLDQLGDLFIQ